MRELGYSDVVFDVRWAEGKRERLPDLAAELVRLKVNIIVSAGTAGPLAAKRATSTIPIVMIGAGDPVASGLGHHAGAAPTKDHLLVFYLPAEDEWEESCKQIVAAGFRVVPSSNPYWDRTGRTFEDLDGFRVVLKKGARSG
jgi:YycE-like protein/ABC transporter substrate binding protein